MGLMDFEAQGVRETEAVLGCTPRVRGCRGNEERRKP